MKVIPETRHVH